MPVGYVASPSVAPEEGPPAPAPAAPGTAAPPIRHDARVLAIVPHHRCEPWLEQCLRSLTRQTRPPDAIVVVDDASPEPPRDIVAGFPAVTLLRARERGGPYRLVQTVIEGTSFDAYLLQDADDWSTDDRLALQLAEAERTGAELVGAQELRVDEAGHVAAVCYPLDAGRLLAAKPDCHVLHPTSLVSRDLVRRIGGYASAYRFGADLEFQLRAHHAARIVNVASFCYFRRRRAGSLWTSPETGEHSPLRHRQNAQLLARAAHNAARVAAGEAPNLAPFNRAGPVALDHVTGPRLNVEATS
jgi:glycosyltransferase involved in cell wall biosynthesis